MLPLLLTDFAYWYSFPTQLFFKIHIGELTNLYVYTLSINTAVLSGHLENFAFNNNKIPDILARTEHSAIQPSERALGRIPRTGSFFVYHLSLIYNLPVRETIPLETLLSAEDCYIVYIEYVMLLPR